MDRSFGRMPWRLWGCNHPSKRGCQEPGLVRLPELSVTARVFAHLAVRVQHSSQPFWFIIFLKNSVSVFSTLVLPPMVFS